MRPKLVSHITESFFVHLTYYSAPVIQLIAHAVDHCDAMVCGHLIVAMTAATFQLPSTPYAQSILLGRSKMAP